MARSAYCGQFITLSLVCLLCSKDVSALDQPEELVLKLSGNAKVSPTCKKLLVNTVLVAHLTVSHRTATGEDRKTHQIELITDGDGSFQGSFEAVQLDPTEKNGLSMCISPDVYCQNYTVRFLSVPPVNRGKGNDRTLDAVALENKQSVKGYAIVVDFCFGKYKPRNQDSPKRRRRDSSWDSDEHELTWLKRNGVKLDSETKIGSQTHPEKNQVEKSIKCVNKRSTTKHDSLPPMVNSLRKRSWDDAEDEVGWIKRFASAIGFRSGKIECNPENEDCSNEVLCEPNEGNRERDWDGVRKDPELGESWKAKESSKRWSDPDDMAWLK